MDFEAGVEEEFGGAPHFDPEKEFIRGGVAVFCKEAGEVFGAHAAVRCGLVGAPPQERVLFQQLSGPEVRGQRSGVWLGGGAGALADFEEQDAELRQSEFLCHGMIASGVALEGIEEGDDLFDRGDLEEAARPKTRGVEQMGGGLAGEVDVVFEEGFLPRGSERVGNAGAVGEDDARVEGERLVSEEGLPFALCDDFDAVEGEVGSLNLVVRMNALAAAAHEGEGPVGRGIEVKEEAAGLLNLPGDEVRKGHSEVIFRSRIDMERSRPNLSWLGEPGQCERVFEVHPCGADPRGVRRVPRQDPRGF
jgi:hypothetical protein